MIRCINLLEKEDLQIWKGRKSLFYFDLLFSVEIREVVPTQHPCEQHKAFVYLLKLYDYTCYLIYGFTRWLHLQLLAQTAWVIVFSACANIHDPLHAHSSRTLSYLAKNGYVSQIQKKEKHP